MYKEHEEIYNAISEINSNLYDELGDDNPALLTMTINSYYTSINLTMQMIEIPIFNSEDDDRRFYEKSNEYENWDKFIKRKFKEIKSEINKVKL